MAEADGSIRVIATIETQKAEKDIHKLAAEVDKAASKIAVNGEKIKEAFDTATLSDQPMQAMSKYAEALRSSLSRMSMSKLDSELAKTAKKIDDISHKWTEIDAKIAEVYALYPEDTPLLENQKEPYEQMRTAALGSLPEESARLEQEKVEALREYDMIQAEILRREAEIAAKKEETVDATERQAEAEKSVNAEIKSEALTRSFENGLRSLKRFTLGILGVRSAYAMLRRAANDYLDSNQELATQLNGIWSVIGQAVGPAIQTVVNWISIAITWINALISALWGINLVANANAASLSKQAKSAGAAAKAQAQLAGFDEMNRLSDASAGGSGGGGASAGDAFKAADIDTTSAERFGAMLKEWYPLVAGIGAGFASWGVLNKFFEGLPTKDKIGWVFTVAGVITEIISLCDMLTNGIDWENFINYIIGAGLAFAALSVFINPTYGAVSLLISGIGLLIAGIVDFIKTGELSGPAFAAIEAGLLAVGLALSLMTGSWIPLAIAAVVGLFVAFAKYGDKIVEFLKGLKAKITDWFDGLDADFHRTIDEFTQYLEDKFGFIGTIVGTLFAQIGEIVSTGVSFIGNTIGTIIDFVTAVVDTIYKIANGDWANAWDSWGTVLEDVKKTFSGIFAGVVNIFIDGVNAIIKGIKKIKFTVPDWVPLVGGKEFNPGKNMSEIPRVKLARGGIVNVPGRGVPAIVGEAGAEAVLPLERNTGWMDMLADRLAARIQNGQIIIPIYLNGKKIAEYVIDLTEQRAFARNGG